MENTRKAMTPAEVNNQYDSDSDYDDLPQLISHNEYEERKRLSIFNDDGNAKSHEEITEIIAKKQWKAVSTWLDERIGVGRLVWEGYPLLPKTIDRLKDMGFIVYEEGGGLSYELEFQTIKNDSK